MPNDGRQRKDTIRWKAAVPFLSRQSGELAASAAGPREGKPESTRTSERSAEGRCCLWTEPEVDFQNRRSATAQSDPAFSRDGALHGVLWLGGQGDYVSLSIGSLIDGVPGQVILSQKDSLNRLMADAAGGTLRTELGSTGRQGHALTSQTPITDGSWHRVGFVWDGSDRALCVDDVEVARDTPTSLSWNSNVLQIGAGRGLEAGSFWFGLIDDVRIYDRAVKP